MEYTCAKDGLVGGGFSEIYFLSFFFVCNDGEIETKRKGRKKGNLTATKVPGRKTSVNIETVFIAELSRFAAAAIFLESSATEMFSLLSRCAIMLYT